MLKKVISLWCWFSPSGTLWWIFSDIMIFKWEFWFFYPPSCDRPQQIPVFSLFHELPILERSIAVLRACLGSFHTNFQQNFLRCWVSPPLNSVFKPGFEPTTSHTVNHRPSATLSGQLPNLLPQRSPKNWFGFTVITRPGTNPTIAYVMVWGAQCTHMNGD